MYVIGPGQLTKCMSFDPGTAAASLPIHTRHPTVHSTGTKGCKHVVQTKLSQLLPAEQQQNSREMSFETTKAKSLPAPSWASMST